MRTTGIGYVDQALGKGVAPQQASDQQGRPENYRVKKPFIHHVNPFVLTENLLALFSQTSASRSIQSSLLPKPAGALYSFRTKRKPDLPCVRTSIPGTVCQYQQHRLPQQSCQLFIQNLIEPTFKPITLINVWGHINIGGGKEV